MQETITEHTYEPASTNAGGFLAGMVIGGLAGAGTMLLLAPQSGRRTRAEIQQKGLELRDQTVENVGNRVADARVQARKMTAPARRQVKVLQHRGQELIDEQRDRLSAGIDQVSSQ